MYIYIYIYIHIYVYTHNKEMIFFQITMLTKRRKISKPKPYVVKWVHTYEGPYVVKQAFSSGTLILTDMEWNVLGRLINSNAIKNYFE